MTMHSPMKAPVAKKKGYAATIHGTRLVDHYYWLRNRGTKEVLEYLEQENRYTEQMMKSTENGQERLYKEMVERIKETDQSVPEKVDDYYYYSRTEKGKQYTIYCRKKGSLDAHEEILLDGNMVAGDREYSHLAALKVSPDHRYLAYSVDFVGDELYTIHVKDTQTGEVLGVSIPAASYSVEWANDNRTFFYTVRDEARRPYRVYRHVLGTPYARDRLIYEEADPAFFVSLYRSKSRKYLFIYLGSATTSEIRFLEADRSRDRFRVFRRRKKGVEYDVTHHGNTFYIHTNEGAVNFKVMATPVGTRTLNNWYEFIPHRPETKIDGLESFCDYLVVYEREQGLKQVRFYDFSTGTFRRVKFDEPVYTLSYHRNPDYNSTILRLTYTSFLTPKTVYDFNLADGTRKMLKKNEVLGGYDPSAYEMERIMAVAADGTGIPISLVYPKGMARDGNNYLLLHGYGAYGSSSEPHFAYNRLSLLQRGFIYGIAHVRGGGVMGRPWYEAGKLLNKKHTFTDYISCVEHLIGQGYTTKGRVVADGMSAGGLLMGAVLNMRPDLFTAMVAEVPFVDVINTMLDPTIPLTVHEYEEWGNPGEKKFFDYMLSYSPYDNVEKKDYPHLLVIGSINDSRVQYWEPAKWVARLRANKTNDTVLLLKTDMGAGHGGASGRYDFLKEFAFKYAFIFHVLGDVEF